jgi:hypothetical protein
MGLKKKIDPYNVEALGCGPGCPASRLGLILIVK